LRRLSTRELLKLIQDTIDDHMERIEEIRQVLHRDLSMEGILHDDVGASLADRIVQRISLACCSFFVIFMTG